MATLAGKGGKVGLISSVRGFFYDLGLATGRALVMVPAATRPLELFVILLMNNRLFIINGYSVVPILLEVDGLG